jgi:hypothetical protein
MSCLNFIFFCFIYYTSKAYLLTFEYSVSFLLFINILLNLILRMIYKSCHVINLFKDIRLIIDFSLLIFGLYLLLNIYLNFEINVSKDIISIYDDILFNSLYLGYIILIIIRNAMFTYIQSKKTTEDNINTVSKNINILLEKRSRYN